MDQPRRAAGAAAPALRGGSVEGAAIAAQRAHRASSGGHNQAAPRTPLESPWSGGRRRVTTRSEKMYRIHKTRDLLVKRRDARKAAPEHDRIRIDQVDHRSQSAGEPVHVALEGRAALRISAAAASAISGALSAAPSMAVMIRRQSRARQKRLQTARSAAIAWRSRDLVRRRPGQRVVAPLSGDCVGADQDLPSDGDPASHARCRE